MLRNRSGAVATSKKQAPMADQTCLSPTPNQNHMVSISSLLGSPRFDKFDMGISCKPHLFPYNKPKFERNICDPGNGISPKSILENREFSNLHNPFGYDPNLPKTPSRNKHIYKPLDSQGIGLAIVDSMKGNSPKPTNKMVLFGSKLKVQIPPMNPSAEDPAAELLKSPADFGTKTPNLHDMRLEKPRDYANKKLSLSEMEVSEDYTCVRTRGPNPKTIHIFDDCIVDSCCSGVGGLSELMKREHELSTKASDCQDFLSFCHTCKNKLQEGKDIYMFRGELAYCSHECRFQGMLSQEESYSEMDF